MLAVGTYTVSGTDADASGDTGTFSYVLTVGPSTIAQASPTGGSTTVDNSKSFTDQLSVTGNNGAVTYTQVSTTSALVAVNATGAVSVSGVLAVGTYTVSGTDADASGDTGTFSYVLTVGPSTIAQASPTGGSTTVDNSKSFTDQLSVTGNNGAVTYTQVSTTSALVAVNATGAVSVSGVLAVGTYTVSGTDADASGDTGTFSYVLTGGSTIAQASPTSGLDHRRQLEVLHRPAQRHRQQRRRHLHPGLDHQRAGRGERHRRRVGVGRARGGHLHRQRHRR